MLSISGMLGDESPVDPRRCRPNKPASPSPSPSTPGRPTSTTTPTTTAGIVGTAASQSPPQPVLRATNVDVSESTTLAAPPPSRKRKSTTPHAPTRQKRPPRPQYTKEQEDFIWFCRDDLSMSWRKVVELYNEQWHPENTGVHPMRSESGLQSRYYRILDFPVKIRKEKEPCRPELGLIPSTTRRYPWMGGGEDMEEQPDRRERPQEQGREYSQQALRVPMRSSGPSFPTSEPIEVDDEIDRDQDPDAVHPCLAGEQAADEDRSGVRQSRLMDMEADGYSSSYSSASESTQAQQTKQPRQSYQPSAITDYPTCGQSTLLALIRASKVSGRVRQQRVIRRNRPRSAEKEKEKEREREKERQGKERQVKAGSAQTRGRDPRLSVGSLCE